MATCLYGPPGNTRIPGDHPEAPRLDEHATRSLDGKWNFQFLHPGCLPVYTRPPSFHAATSRPVKPRLKCPFPLKEEYSAATSGMGRFRNPYRCITATAQSPRTRSGQLQSRLRAPGDAEARSGSGTCRASRTEGMRPEIPEVLKERSGLARVKRVRRIGRAGQEAGPTQRQNRLLKKKSSPNKPFSSRSATTDHCLAKAHSTLMTCGLL